MTIGIYSIYWEKPDLIYIGQSEDIERRFKEHIRKMRTQTHFNYKVQNAYNVYGIPEFSILETSNIEDLDTLEVYWVNEFDSIHKGLNINEPGTQGGSGVNHPSAKYSRFKYLRIFARLYKGILSIQEISYIEKVPYSIVAHICKGDSHKWLEEEYSEKYKLMIASALKRKSNNTRGGRKSYIEEYGEPLKLIHKDGSILYIYNITQDCKKYNLSQSAISALISGARATHKQYSILK